MWLYCRGGFLNILLIFVTGPDNLLKISIQAGNMSRNWPTLRGEILRILCSIDIFAHHAVSSLVAQDFNINYSQLIQQGFVGVFVLTEDDGTLLYITVNHTSVNVHVVFLPRYIHNIVTTMNAPTYITYLVLECITIPKHSTRRESNLAKQV